MKLEEVARRAKVSTATVSRVLNNAPQVRSSTRVRVMKAVEELKYSPNLQARSLAGGKSKTIGIIVSNIENPFFLDVFRAVETSAAAKGYEVVLANTDYRREQLMASVRQMIGRRVAGIAVIVSEMDPELVEELNRNEIPVVFYGAGALVQGVKSIRVNYRRGMEKVTDYLYSMGHRRLGCIGHHAKLGPIGERLSAVTGSIARYPDLEVQIAYDKDGPEGGRCATRALLSAHPHVTAILCVNDFMALGALREIREMGLRVPEDISVTGFDNVALAQYCHPALTSVDIPRGLIGQNICNFLISNEEVVSNREILIEPELVLRDSTGRVSESSGSIQAVPA